MICRCRFDRSTPPVHRGRSEGRPGQGAQNGRRQARQSGVGVAAWRDVTRQGLSAALRCSAQIEKIETSNASATRPVVPLGSSSGLYSDISAPRNPGDVAIPARVLISSWDSKPWATGEPTPGASRGSRTSRSMETPQPPGAPEAISIASRRVAARPRASISAI